MNKSTPVPLENIPEERVILGRLLQAESAFWMVADVLKPEHFSRPIHAKIFGAIRDILNEGKKLSLVLIQARIGEEYDDGASTMTLMTALLRDAEGGDLEGVEQIVDLWRHRQLIVALEQGLKDARKPNAVAADLLLDHQTRLQDIVVNSQSEPLKSLGQIADRVITRSRKAMDAAFVPGFDTGLASLDEILGRIHPGDLGFIGARPGDGKSVLAAQLAMRAQEYGPAIYFQLEMTDEDMAARVLAGRTNVSVADIESGQYDFEALDDLQRARDALLASRVYIDDRPKLRIDQIRDRIAAVKRSKGLILAVVDHIRLVAVPGVRDRFDRTEVVTGELKAIAKANGIAIIALAQLTRSSQKRDDPLPTLNDFNLGSSIEEDADFALGLLRRDRWLRTRRPPDMDTAEGRKWLEQYDRWKGKIEVACLKRRRGEDGEVRDFEFDGRRGLLKEVER